MKNTLGTKNSYLISCVYCILLLLLFCYFGINYNLKGTRAGFGGLTGCLSPTINVSYFSNYPENIENLDVVTQLTCNQHIVSNNMYDVPNGYEFDGWDTNQDGSGNRLSAGFAVFLEEDINLYAQWVLINDDEIENNPNDGNDGTSSEDGTDNNNSSGDKENVEDEGNDSEGNIDYPKDDGTTDDDKNPSDSNGDKDISSGETDTDSGSEGGTVGENNNNNSSNPSDGNNSGNNSEQNTNNNQNNGNKVDSSFDKNTNNEISKEEESVVPEKQFYNFKFIVNDNIYVDSVCEVLSDGSCLLLLPGVNPTKKGYTFTGWSLNKDCPVTELITKSISVNSSNTYYACFIKNAINNTGVNFVTVGITVFVIWVVALTLIYCLVKWFKKKESND